MFTISALTAICDTSQLLAYSGYFFGQLSKVLFDANLFLLLAVYMHMKLIISKTYHFLKILTNCVDSMLFHCFMILKTSFQNILKLLS